MRINKEELFAIASQTSQNFDREGVLLLKERQDSFFRRSEGYSSRWFRLRGNLLFYLKGPEPGNEPLGLIVLGNHQVSIQNQDENGHWPFQLVWENGACYRMCTLLESERTLWLKAMTSAPYEHMNQRIGELHRQLRDTRTRIDLKKYRCMNKIIQDFDEVPVCELVLSFDNLLCDANGNPPSPFAVIFAMISKENKFVRYGCTEVVEKCSNPNFLRTTMFRKSDGIQDEVKVRVVVYNMREMVSQTGVPIGTVTVLLGHIQEAQRLRVPLVAAERKVVGFVTFNVWSLEPALSPTSPTNVSNPEKSSIDLSPKLPAHRRTRSLPSRMGLKLQHPTCQMYIRQNFVNPIQATYHFHSGLGGDIIVQEVMAEAGFGITMPLQLLHIFIAREQELQHSMMAFAEVSKRQSQELPGFVGNYHNTMRLLKVTILADDLVNLHVAAIKDLETAKNNMISHSLCFKSSIRKRSPELSYVPVNLHLQRLWAHNDSLNKKGFHDIITVGAFTAHSLSAPRPGGLLRLLQLSKDLTTCKAEMTANTNRLDAEFEKLRTMKKKQNSLINLMDSALLLLHNGLFVQLRKEMAGIRLNTSKILNMWDIEATEEALSKVGWSKKRIDAEDSERKRADQLALQARLMEPGGIAHRSACAAAAIATVANLSTPSIAIHTVVTTSIADVVNSKDKLRTAAGVAAGFPDPTLPGQAGPKAADGENPNLNVVSTTIDAATPEPASMGQKVAPARHRKMIKFPATDRSRSEVDSRKYFNYISLEQTNTLLGLKRTLSESDLALTSQYNIIRNSPRNDCGKVGKNMAATSEGNALEAGTSGSRAARTSKSRAAGTSGLSVAGTSGLSAAGTSGSRAARTSKSRAAGTSGLSVAGTSGSRAAGTSGLSAAGTSGSRTARTSGSRAAGTSGLSVAGPSGTSVAKRQPQQTSRPGTNGNNKRGKGCKNNRAPKVTKHARREANREARLMTPGGQASEETSQFERLFNKHANYSTTSVDQITLGNILFNRIGNTRQTKNNRNETAAEQDPEQRSYNLKFFLTLNHTVREMVGKLFFMLNMILLKGLFTPSEFEDCRIMMDLTVKLLEEIQKWACMAHTAMRIDTEPFAWVTEHRQLRTRRDICLTQAVTAVAAGVLSWAANTPKEIVVKIVESGLGPLLEFEGLLSMYSDEVTMWGDMIIAVEDLNTLTYKFVTCPPDTPLVPQVIGSRGSLTIEIPIEHELHEMFVAKSVSPKFTVTAVFFNIGINDKASLAESLGDNKPQYMSNKDNFDRISKYYRKYCQQFPQDPFEQFRVSSRSRPLEEVMENLRAATLRRNQKNVEVLQLASLATRLMHGIRFTSCKSAKDRTGMSVTLEQATILSDEYHLADDERKHALDAMRSEGCRRENIVKNTGQRKYAFSQPQVMSLPAEYRPPLGSYGELEKEDMQ